MRSFERNFFVYKVILLNFISLHSVSIAVYSGIIFMELKRIIIKLFKKIQRMSKFGLYRAGLSKSMHAIGLYRVRGVTSRSMLTGFNSKSYSVKPNAY